MPLTMLTSVKSGIIMTINSCRNRANFAEQMITEGAVLYTKNNNSPVSYGHMPALPLAKE
jgi:hypothetical protein